MSNILKTSPKRSTFFMSADNKERALVALQSKSFRDKIKSRTIITSTISLHLLGFGGKIRDGKYYQKSFIYPDQAKRFDFSDVKTIEKAFTKLGYKIKVDKEGNITDLKINCRSREYMLDPLIFYAIAPFVSAGSKFCFLDEGVLPEVWWGEFDGEKYTQYDKGGVFDIDGYINQLDLQ